MIFAREAANDAVQNVIGLHFGPYQKALVALNGSEAGVHHSVFAAAVLAALSSDFQTVVDDLLLSSAVFELLGRKVAMEGIDALNHPVVGQWSAGSLLQAVSGMIFFGATMGSVAPNAALYQDLVLLYRDRRLVTADVTATLPVAIGGRPGHVEALYTFGELLPPGSDLEHRKYPTAVLMDLGERAYIGTAPDSIAEQRVYGAAVDPQVLLQDPPPLDSTVH